MKLVIQRVKNASLSIDNEIYSRIGPGMVVLTGIEDADNDRDLQWLAAKLSKLRIFDDENGIPNLSIMDIDGEIMIVSQFTLHASTKKGNRPSYIRAARPEKAIPIYEKFVITVSELTGKTVQTGRFGAMMQVSLVNDGPVTIIIDSKNAE